MDRIEMPHDPGILSGVSKMIFEHVVCLAQTMHLSYVKISTISKRTKTSIDLTLVTKEDHQVRPKWFLSLWYVLRKPCTYLAPTLTLYPNRPKWDSTWPTSPRSSFGANHTPILHWHLTQSPNRPKWDSTWPTSPRWSIGCVQNYFHAYGTFGTNRQPIFPQD
jgi:hypothetical protein